MTGDQEQGPVAQSEPLVWKPRGHPVRRAAGVVVAIAAVCFVSIWFGAVTPRIGSLPVSVGTDPEARTDDGVVAIAFEVTNQAHSDATLLDAGETVPGLRLVSTELADTSGTALNEHPRLSSGGTALVTLRYEVTNCWAVDDHPAPIPVHLRTMLGFKRTVDGPKWSGRRNTGEPTPWTVGLVEQVC